MLALMLILAVSVFAVAVRLLSPNKLSLGKVLTFGGVGIASLSVALMGFVAKSPANNLLPITNEVSSFGSVSATVKSAATVKPVSTTSRVSETETISFVAETRESPQYKKGTQTITQVGRNGQKTNNYLITLIDGKEVGRTLESENVTTTPVSQITTVGTYIAPAAALKSVSGARTGAACNDGTHSNATGSGACSHHHGVANWIYE